MLPGVKGAPKRSAAGAAGAAGAETNLCSTAVVEVRPLTSGILLLHGWGFFFLKQNLMLTPCPGFGWAANLNAVFVFLQLDPQTLQNKDWQRTVIGMNGVRLPSSYEPLLSSQFLFYLEGSEAKLC